MGSEMCIRDRPRAHSDLLGDNPMLAHAGKQGRRVVAAFIATAFAQEDGETARGQCRQVADQIRPKVAKPGRSRWRVTARFIAPKSPRLPSVIKRG